MMEVAQSIQQTTYDQFNKAIKEKADNKSDLVKVIVEILESPSLNTFSEFLSMKEIDEVSRHISSL